MATEVWPELTNIQDEDVLRKMWQETEDFGRKKEIRARMYKLREQRLKDFYTTGDTQTEVSLRKTKTHTESIGDQGSFLTMKTKEIRDSESPTRDISCTRREQKWTTSYGGDKKGTRSDNANVVRTQQIVSVEPTEIIESSTVTSGKTSSQRVAQSSSVQTSKVSSQSVQQSSKSEVRHSENTQVASGQEISAQSNVRQITSGNEESSLTSNVKTVTGETQSQRVSADSRTQQGGESVATTRTIKQSSSGGPEEIITTTVTTYTTSDKSQPPLKQTSVRVIKRDDQYEGGLNDKERNLSSVVETRTIVKSEPQITQSVSESVTRSQHVQQNQKSTYSTQSASSTVQKSSTSVEKQGQNVSARISENQVYDSNNIQENVNKQTSNINNDLQRYVVQDTDITERRTVQDSRDQKVQKNDQVQITEVETYEQDRNVTNVQNRRDSRTDNKKQDIVKKTTDVVGSQRNVLIDDNITNKTQTNQQTSRLNTTNKTQNEQVHVKSSTSTTDQKILNEIQKLDTYLSTQPTPSNSVPISPQNIIDANWPVDKEFVYTDSAPRDNKVLVNGDRSTPVRHPTNLELPKGATDGQYVTTYQHDYSPRVSSDLSSNHQYFASTLRASPDRSSPSPSKRSSSKGSLDRSTPDRKFRASPSRKTPDHERRLSSSSYTIERISDNKRHATDVKEKSQTLPKDSSKPKRKLSSTQTKAANKTRVSTPGASPTSSPTRVQRPRKRSTSDSDSDHSNATFNKTTALRKTETDETKKYGSTTRIRGSSTSVNFTDAEGRPLSSPSPVRHPARENTPDYSSEGSITRELRTLRTEKPSNNFDSSPERSAFAPIKSFQTSPERKDQSLNMINEERRHILQAKTSSNVNISETVTERSTNSDVNDTRTSTIETRHLQTPDSRPERDSPDRISDVVDTERVKFTDQTSSDNKPRHTTPASSPERKVKKDKPESNRPLSYGRPSPDRKSTTPVSSPDRKSKSPLRSLDRKPKTPVGSPDRKTKTPISSPDRKPKTPISSPDRKPKTPISSPDRKPRTPISSPDRRSPTKQDRTSSERQSPTKPRYQSPVTTQKVPDYARPKTSSVVTEKASVVRKTTKTTEGDRITRRSSIPRAEVKYSSRPVREPDNKPKTSYTRETASSTTRVSTTRTSTSPALYQPKTSVTKSVDRTSFRDTKLSTPKKPESTGLKKPSSKPGQTSPVKFSPVDSTKPKTKTPIGSKRDIPIRTNETVAGRKDTVTKSSTTVKKDQDLKTTTKKTKKEITHTDSKEIINRKLKEQISVDKESNDSIDDEQPPEFFDEFDDRDETDRISTEKIRTDLTDFKHHETDHTIINTCDTRTTEKNITDTKVTHKVTDDSTKFITAEQSPSRPSKPGSVQSSTPKKKPDSNKPTKLKDTSKPSKKKPTGLRSLDDGSSSSSDEEEIIIKYDDYSDIKETDTHQVKITKRDASKANQVTDNSKNTLKVQVQHPKSSRESSPEKSIPLSVTSDGGQTPRYADFVIEPEDVEVFDSSNLGPNRPIPSTVLDENRIIEESDSSTRENEKVSVAERVSKYTEKTNKIDIVTLDTSRDQNNSSSDVSKTKELFENITKHHPEDNQTLERRGSKKFIDVNEFIKNESTESIRRSDVTTSQSTVDTVDKAHSTITKREAVYQQTPVVQKPVSKKQPSSEDVLKKSERRLSEHAPDIESKKAFFEKKSKDTVTTETVKTIPISPKEPLKSASPFDPKVPHYMKDTETTVTRKESIQREFAPVRQGTETDMSVPSKEKRSSIDIEKMEEFIRSESYQVDKEAKTPIAHPVSVKDFINKRRSSTEVQELDTFKKAEAYILCEDRTRNVSEKRSSVDMQKNVITTVTKKEPTDTKRKPSLVKSPEPSPTRKSSKDKSTDRVPLKKKDTNIMSEERVNETKTGKFGVTLRRTSTSGVTSTPKVSQPQVFLPDQLPEIEEIFDLIILEVLLTRAVLYDERRRIRAQIRIVKKNLESEQNQQPTRRPQTTTKSERGVKEEIYQRKDLARIDRSSPRDRKHTPSPTKDTRTHDEHKKTGYRASPDRSVRTSVDRRDLQKGFEDKRTSSDKNGTTVTSVKNYTSPDKKYSIKETKTETRNFSASSPERRSTTTVETISRKSTPYPVMGGERKTSSYESRAESHSTYSRGSPERRTSETNKTGTFTRSPERRTVKEETNKTGTFTRTPTGTAERKTSSSFESRLESHSTYSRSSPERRTPDSTKTGTFTRSPERRIVREEETRKTDTFTRSPDRKPSKSSPERKPSYETRRTSETIKTTSRSSPERRVSKDQETRSYSSKTEERRSSETRKTSRTSPDRKYSSDYDSRKTSETRNYSRASPDRKLSTDTTETTRTSSQVHRSSAQYSTTTTSVGRKGEDSITSSYGVGPTDDQGRPLFGLRALRSTNKSPDEPSDIEVGEDVGDGLEDLRGSDGRPLFGLKAIKSVTTSSTTTTVTSSDMPSTQHLVQKHQQFLSEVKSSEEKVKGEAPRARLRDSFILDGDETGTTVVPALSHAQGVSLKSIIQKHEDMATTGKNVRREVQSTKTVTSSHGTVTSDGKVSLSKHIIHGEMRGKDGAEPTGRITTSQYSYKSPDDPLQKPHVTSTTTTTHLGASQRNSITSLGEVRIEEHKENDSRRDSLVSSARKSLESRQKEESLKQSESERKTIVRGDSIKALQHKFQQPTGVNQVNQKPTYPKAGLILRSNSLTQSDDQNHLSSSMKRTSGEERRSSVEERRSSIKDEREESTRTTSKTSTTSVTSSSTRRDSGSNLTSKTTTREGSKSATSFLDDTSKVTGVQDILQRMRNADLVTENNDTTEDAEARSLLNKFLGASVILQGMEAGGAGPASSALVSQVERQRILTSTQRKTDDIDEITDEKQLQILLEACCDYEQRRKIRARLRKIMADRKGGQGELVGGEDREERREGELVGRWVEDSGTESGEERKGVEEAVEEVKGALERLTSALPRLAGNLGGSVSDLVAKLQNCLSTPAPPPRKNKRRHHTVGVTAEEIARARKWAERPRPLQITRGEFKALEHKAGFFIEPQPQTATISFNSPPLDTAPPINYDPSATLFTPAQSVQIAVHKAAIQKQISQEETNVRRVSLQRQMSQEDIRKKESDGESSSDEEISPARRLLKIASKRRTRISKIKRSNTVEIPRPATYCDSDTDDPAYSSDRSDLKRKSCGGLYAVPPPFLPKTDNDIKFLDFLNKVNDASSKVISYNPSARGGKHWSNRFSRIKTTFEDQSSADEKEKEVPKGKSSPFPQQKNFIQPKLPWSVKQEGDVVVGSLTVAKKVPGPVNQFTHAPMSAFKPVEKKVFPSSVSGSVKQLASQKFAPQAEPEIIKPVPSVPPRNHPKYQPVPGPDASPLSQRFVPNKVSGVQQHPPAHTYLNQFANYSPKHVNPPNDKTPLKTPNKIQEPVSNGAHYKQSHSVNKSSNFINSQPSNDFNHWKAYQESKPELPAKPILNYNRSIEPPSKSVPISSNHNQSMQHPAKSVSNYTRSIDQPAKPIPNYTQPIVPVPNPHQPLEHPVKSISNYSQPLDLPVKPVLNYSKSLDSTDNPDTNFSRHIGNPKPVPSYSKPILQTLDSVNQSNYSAYSIADHKVNRDSPKAIANYNITSQEPSLSSQNVLITDYNSNWTGEGINNSKGGLSIPNQSRDSDSLSPHPYKGCYVYNENNEILSTSPYMPPSNVNIHVPVSPSYREPIYQNISEVHNSSSYLLPSDLPNNLLPPYQVNGLRTPDKIPLPHQFTESGTFYPSDQGYNNHSVIREPVQRQRNVTNSPKYDLPSYYPSQDPDAKKGSHDSLIEFTHRDDYSPEYAAKASPYVVYNNCPNGKRGSNECLNSFSPAFGNLSGTNSRGDSPRGSEEWDECVEEKAVVGRVMGEAQCQRAVTQSRRVESRFPNAPPSTNLLRPPPEPAKIPSPILKTRQDHSMAPKNGSPKSLSPSFPNVLHKSESWHQMVKEQMMQAKQAPPLPAKVVKTKSSHTLALPKQFEGALHPEVAQRLQSTVSQYMSKSPSSQRPLIKAGSVPCGGEDIENVDEAFESLFREVSKKRNSK